MKSAVQRSEAESRAGASSRIPGGHLILFAHKSHEINELGNEEFETRRVVECT